MTFRDRCNPLEPHTVRLEGVELVFGAGGVLRNPTPEQREALTRDAMRCQRFAAVDEPTRPAAPRRSPAPEKPAPEARPATEETRE